VCVWITIMVLMLNGRTYRKVGRCLLHLVKTGGMRSGSKMVNLVRLAILLPVLAVASYTDYRRHEISNRACAFLVIMGVAMPLLPFWDITWKEAVYASLITITIGFIFFLLGQGAGDAKLFAGIASIIGYNILRVAVTAFVLSGIVALLLLVARKINYKSSLPMAPAISIATLICLLMT